MLRIVPSLGHCLDAAAVDLGEIAGIVDGKGHHRRHHAQKFSINLQYDLNGKENYYTIQNLEELEDHYRRGGLGDVKVKKFLNKVMQAELGPIRARRKEWEQRIPDVLDILKEGSRVAQAKAAETLNDVKASMRINYFDSDQSDMYQK